MIYELPNLDYLDQLAAENSSVRESILRVMIHEFEQDLQEYKKAKISGDWSTTSNCVLRLKHKIGILGMDYSYQIANRYEKELQRNSDRFAIEFEAVLDEIQKFITTISSQ